MLARLRFPGRTLVRALVTIPFVMPTVLVASAFLALGVERSLGAILLAHVFFNYAVVVRVVGELWRHLDPHEEAAARVLGASRWRAFREVTLPALRPGIVAAATITFLFCFTSFGVILLLGGPTRSTIETEIYRQTTRFLDLPLAAALSIVQLVTVVVLLWLAGRFERRAAVPRRLRAGTRGRAPAPRPRRPRAPRRQPRGDGGAARASARGARRPLADPAVRASASRTTARSGTCARAARCSCRPLDAVWNSVRFALDRHGDRGRGRRPRRVGRAPARSRAGSTACSRCRSASRR